MRRIVGSAAGLIAMLVGAAGAARADERDVLRAIEAFFQTTDVEVRARLVEQIQTDPEYEREKIGKWLHRARLFEKRKGGDDELNVELPNGRTRRVTLRIPPGYSPARAYPLIYALHGSGGNGENVTEYVQFILGDAVSKYVVAAPTGYDPNFLCGRGKPSDEHRIVLRAIKKYLHIDSDRVYVLGYSLGGYTTWDLSILYADQFAAAVPVAGGFALAGADALWDDFLPNVAHLPILNAWGALDTEGRDEQSREWGGIAGLNRMLTEHTQRLELPVEVFVDPEKAHGGVCPPRGVLLPFLRREREHYPKQVQHTCEHVNEAQAYWIEGHEWKESRRKSTQPERVVVREGEDPQDAILRSMRARFGELRGTIDGQTLDVRRKFITELTVWVGDGMIDWSRPAAVKVSGRVVYEGTLEPDLFVCLSQAARTYDFDRLRWAGVRFKSGSKAELVTGRSEYAPIGTP